MYCEKCGAKLEDGANFCTGCGAAIEPSKPEKKYMYCVKCGEKLTSDVKFCTKCGAAIVGPVQQEPTQNPNVSAATRRNKVFENFMVFAIAVFLIFGGFFTFVDFITEDSDGSNMTSSEQTDAEEKPLSFLDGFTEYGYTADQIEEMRTILTNVGITEITDLEIGNVSYGMQTVKGIAFKDTSFGGGMKEVQVRFSIENGVIYFVHIYCPSYMHENQIPYLSGLTDRRAELYYDSAGGYLKRIDWEKKSVVDYEVLSTETDSNGEIVIGSDKYHPYILTVEEFSNELLTDFQAASEKYDGKWVKITGRVLDTSDAGTMYCYYIYGEEITTGYRGMRIICWCDDGPYSGSDMGSMRTFLGFVSIESSSDPIYVGGCEITR